MLRLIHNQDFYCINMSSQRSFGLQRTHHPLNGVKEVTVAESSPQYSIGDMVVHRYYGIGKIEGIENKPIDGEKIDCFKVSTGSCVYWFPKDSTDNPRVHPVTSQEMIDRAADILQSAPNDLENDPLQWKERIDNVVADGSILAISTLVRDLNALKTRKNLNRTQDKALSN